ncbi:hypothetical protein KTT66_06145 [Lacticaseibacillus casei]|jgi:ABC-type thiamin/hydroxymethylpyrimidine transport system permease subunit|uniref:DUF4305 domain-containing protein n=1 Tax=Lacticaseibacillus huelsenbergensis TaxID=3035291 RepID=A0ABY8DQ04_9LACO|nr:MULTISPECIES: hypothetical protein [Lacticaseibacillus]MDG3061335.1 hypothetical protein [Lacticaseibacillus sp. BCRC 81376]QVI38642.1 hypothetical protein KGS74_06910 [Lacticaseibacillus casei]QXG60369.1 hypothetical protein KTT66_06145 [Lacticaseibacillus casei]WFB38077.1 hypothetical protein LHUE1_001538 [Lacticaseibacillus huelsenbergensis]WFB42480.1 hypothetical protein LHUE2_000461 [Lacticaseibacillus huelsenbergensis]
MRKLWIAAFATFFIASVLGVLYGQVGGGLLLVTALAFGVGNDIILIVILYKSISRIFKS